MSPVGKRGMTRHKHVYINNHLSFSRDSYAIYNIDNDTSVSGLVWFDLFYARVSTITAISGTDDDRAQI